MLAASAPMWAKFQPAAPDQFATGQDVEETDIYSEDEDTMPEPSTEKPVVETPKPVVPPQPVPGKPEELGQTWHSPDYSHQEKALGYSSTAFAVPDGMKDRVQFWIDVYTKYTNDQGLIHDSKYLHLIYETVDLSDITANSVMTPGEKDRAKRKRIKALKKAVGERLKSLAQVKDPSSLQSDDLRYWKLFEQVDEKNKFTEAARRGRLRYQAGQKDQFMRGITQSGRYLRQMEEIFRDEGLPMELTRVPFVESSFNLNARSKRGASGIWQFMRSSGRLYLHIDDACDERNDPLHATRAAARKFRQEYPMTESWPLAITGWNHGAAGIRRMIERYETKDIVELTDVRRGRFGFASANFFASFLAALEVEKNAGKYFGILPVLPEVKGEEVRLDKDLPVAQVLKWFNDNDEIARLYNPHLRGQAWSKKGRLHRKDFVRVPPELIAKVKLDLNGAAASN